MTNWKILLRGYGWTPHFVEGSDPSSMHQAMAATLDHCISEIHDAQREARATGVASRPRWPMIVLRSPKGWSAPETVDGHRLEGFWRAHQVPLRRRKKGPRATPAPRKLDARAKTRRAVRPSGRLIPELKALAPKGTRRMGANPHANGGILNKALRLPDFREYGPAVAAPGGAEVENTRPGTLPSRRDEAEP